MSTSFYLMKNRRFFCCKNGDFVFLPTRAWSTFVHLGARVDKCYLTFSTSVSLCRVKKHFFRQNEALVSPFLLKVPKFQKGVAFFLILCDNVFTAKIEQ